MKKILKNYKSTLILLLAIIIGAIVGIIFKEDAKVLSPLGDIFINLLLVVIVPLVFLTITTSIAKMSTPKRLGKIMITTIVAFLVTSIVAVIVGFITTYQEAAHSFGFHIFRVLRRSQKRQALHV